MLKRKSGFTIVELLIVIVVIGILAAITIVAYNGIQDRSRASYLVSDLKKIEKAFRLFGTDQGISTWWLDNALTGTANPNINTVISSTNLKDYLQTLNPIPGYPTSYYMYDSDGDSINTSTCTASTGGTSIYVTGASQTLAQLTDSMIDDGDITCGKLRWYAPGNQIMYVMASSPAF